MISFKNIEDDHYKYELMGNYHHTTGIGIPATIRSGFLTLSHFGFLTIFQGYQWDGPSGPTFDTASFMRGSLVHDALYQLMREGKLPQAARKPADRLLNQINKEDGMSWWRRFYVYRMVRLFAGGAASQRG